MLAILKCSLVEDSDLQVDSMTNKFMISLRSFRSKIEVISSADHKTSSR